MKKVDDSGFWKIENNPITKEGVYPYLGRQISPKLEPNKIYYVYRPLSELTNPETIESFNGVPMINDHEMIGEGFTPYDKRPAGGVLFNPIANDKGLNGDLKIYSEKLKNEIKSGKKELSLGYLCDYELSEGEFNGQKYDAIQRNIRGNHIALVNKGRMGSDVRVYDHAVTMDSMDVVIDIKNKWQSLSVKEDIAEDEEIPLEDGSPKKSGDDGFSQQTGEDEMADKREAIREIMAIAAKPASDFEGGEEEKIETIAKLLEKSEYSASESSKADDKAVKDKKAADEEVKEDKAEDKCGKDEDKEDKKEEKAEDAKKAMDELSKEVMARIAERDELVKSVQPLVGSFACDSMTIDEVASYACDKLGLDAKDCDAKAMIRGYIAAQGKQRVFGLDSADKENGIDKASERYLKGE